MRSLGSVLFLLLVVVVTGCSSNGTLHHRQTGPVPAGIAALEVSVGLNLRARGMNAFRAELEQAMIRRYRQSGPVAFRQIQFLIDELESDRSAPKDLWLRGRLIVLTRRGTETRTIERRIHGGASTHPDEWADPLIPTLLSAFDYQLSLMKQ